MSTPPAVRLSELPAAEARRLLDWFVRTGPERLEAFVGTVRDRGGPADRLDRSLASLEPVWTWLLSHRPSPAPDEVVRREGPWWYPFHPPFGQELGPELANLVTGMAEYFYACAQANHAAAWRLGRRRGSAEFQHPVLALQDRGEMVYAVPIVAALQGFRGERTEPAELRRLLERWLGRDPDHEAELQRLARPLGRFAVQPMDEGEFTHRVDVEEGVAHRQARRVERLVIALAGDARIESIAQEDREVILVRAPGLEASEVERLVTASWTAVRRS